MSLRLHTLIMYAAVLVLVTLGFFYIIGRDPGEIALQNIDGPATSTPVQVAAVEASLQVPPPPAPAAIPPKTTVATTTIKKAPIQAPPAQTQPDNQALRIKNPYSFPASSFETINTQTRPALVNIFCAPRTGGTLSPISGSGVLIDPRGVILTNAHVAQYVLLAQSGRVNLSCTVRIGAPAAPKWNAEILYIPPVWVEAHADEITSAHPKGTGEHDYALLRITGSIDGAPLPAALPYVPVDVRDGIGFKGDQVLVVSYPAEFLAPSEKFNMYPASSITVIGQLMTFLTKTVDIISLGGIIEAQGGSSGGAVVNPWGRLVGMISTTSEGETTADRDLRALTLSYIDRDLAQQSRFDIATTLGGDIAAEALDFNTNVAPKLIDLYLERISR